MKKRHFLMILLTLALLQLGMGRREGQYDEEAREQERQEKQFQKEARKHGNPVKNIADGVKQATYGSTTDLLEETADGTQEDAAVGTLEGARRGTGKVLDDTVKGAVKVATLGYGDVDNYEVKEPEKGSGDTTKIKIKIPGT